MHVAHGGVEVKLSIPGIIKDSITSKQLQVQFEIASSGLSKKPATCIVFGSALVDA